MSLGRFANSLRFLPSLRLYSSRLIPQGDLILTKAAKQRLDEILSPEEKLRIEVSRSIPYSFFSRIFLKVEGGGCAGFEYKIRLDTTVAPDDLVVKDGEKELVIVDEVS